MTVSDCAEHRGDLEPDSAEGNKESSLTFTIPDDVTPGVTTLSLQIKDASAPIQVRVPEEARAGDKLILKDKPGEGMEVRLVQKTMMHPSSKPAGGTAKKSVTVEIPENATPGETILQVAVGDSRSLKLTVPQNAQPGDRLKLQKNDSGEWTCQVVKVHSTVAGPGDAPAPVPKSEQASDTVYTLTCQVPYSATPGQTRLRVQESPGQEPLLVLVPERALGGDKLELRKDAQGGWDVRVLRVQTPVTLNRVDLEVPQDELYKEMAESARAAGGIVNKKMVRGCAPPLNIMGIVATGQIEPEEELCVMPSALFLSPPSCEEAMPELYAAVLNLPSLAVGKRKEAAHIACVASILGRVHRRVSGEDEPEDLNLKVKHPAVAKLWIAYAHMLLGEAYCEMPLWHVVEDGEAIKNLLEPSMERQDMSAIGGDMVKTHEIICQGVEPAVLGAGFSLGIFLHARLAILSRAFSTGMGTSLIACTDLFNHSSDPSAMWEWDEKRDAHLLVSKRRHEPGEEILISYGKRSNTTLFRTYGFTLPPAVEPVWTYTLNVNDPWGIHRKYLPEHQTQLVIELDSNVCRDSLIKAINGCLEVDTDACEMLGELCRKAMELFEKDPRLEKPLAALRSVREVDPKSAAWWTLPGVLDHLKDIKGSVPARWQESAILVKMSEYLCLLSYQEVLDCVHGRKTEEECFQASLSMREILLQGLQWARDKQPFVVTTTETSEDAILAKQPSG